MRSLVSVVCVVGCGGGSPSALQPTAGARLEVMWFATESGQRVALAGDHWWDSTLDIPCRLDRTDDGGLRCVPRTFVGSLTSRASFSESTCTQTAIFTGFAPNPKCPSLYNPQAEGWATTSAPPPAACTGYPWAPILDVLANPMAFHRADDGTCVPDGPTSFGYTIGPTVPASRFIGFAEPGAPTDSARLQPRVRIAEDGAREPAGIWDRDLALACEPGDPGDGVTRCLPRETATAYYFADAACTRHVAVAFAFNCGDPPAVAKLGASTYFKLGTALATPSMLFESRAGTCQPAVNVPTGSYFDLGPEVALSEFSTLHDVALTGGRIVEHGWTDDGGEVIARNASLHDTMLDVDVEPQFTDDNTVVLAPRDWASILKFADAGCTQALVEGEHRPRLATLDRTVGGCTVRHLFEVGEEVHPAQVFEGESCTPTTVPPKLFAVGRELAPSAFVGLAIQRN